MKSKFLKKLLSVMLVGTAVFSLAACSGGDGEEEQPETQETAENADTEAGEGAALIAYFSWSGNTEAVAQEIQAQTGADLFEIVPAEPYTDDYDELLDIAQEEQSSDARPAIAETVDLSGYDTVYLGFPNWWGDMPCIHFWMSMTFPGRRSLRSIQAEAADFPVLWIPSQRWSRRQRSQKGLLLEAKRQRTAQMRWQSGLPTWV